MGINSENKNEFKQNSLREKGWQRGKKNGKLDSDIDKIYEYQVDQSMLKTEYRSRRDSIRIDGIKKTTRETWNEYEEKVQDMFAQKLGLDGIEIECAHQVKRDNRDSITNRTWAIVVKLLRSNEKTKIFQNANQFLGQQERNLNQILNAYHSIRFLCKKTLWTTNLIQMFIFTEIIKC